MLVLADFADNLWGCYSRLAPTDGSWENATGLLVSGKYFADTAVRDFELAADIARPDAQVGHFNDAHANRVGQRAAVDKNSAELIDFAVW